MADEEHLAIIRLGLLDPSLKISDIWNEWRKCSPEVNPDLTGAKLRRFPLQYIDFSNCNLEKIDLNRANLNCANFENSNLKGAFLYGVKLECANLKNANLEGAFLKYANITHANFEDANLKNATFDVDGWDEPIGLEITAEELLKKYAAGERCFRGLEINTNNKKILIGANFKGIDLAFAGIYANLTSPNLTDANLTRYARRKKEEGRRKRVIFVN